MGISNIAITNITDIETLELNPGGGGPSPGGEPVFPKFVAMDGQNEVAATANIWAATVLARMMLQDGDLLIAIISSSDNSPSVVTPTQAGWTPLFSIHRSSGTTCSLYYRIVNTATDPAAYDFSWTNGGDACTLLLNIRGADQADPFPDSYVRVEGTSTPTYCPDITTTHDGMLVLNIASTQNAMQGQTGGGYRSSTMATGAANYPFPVDSPGFVPFSRLTADGTNPNFLFGAVNHVRDAGLVAGASWPWNGIDWQSFAIAVKSASQ